MRFIALRLLFCIFLLGSFATSLRAQEATPPRFSATSRLVTVDVVALDRAGKPVQGLTRNDFQIWEEGKSQQIAHYQDLRAGASQNPAPQEPGVYTNDPESAPVRGPAVIMLLDFLNTPIKDRPFVRKTMLEYLARQVLPGQPIAVYALGNGLVLLQDFTTDPRLLLAAIGKINVANARGPDTLVNSAAEVAKSAGYASMSATDIATAQAMIDGLQHLDDEMQQQFTMNRSSIALESMRLIARSSNRFPGRKALVWVSAAFPLCIDADGSCASTIAPEIRKTVNTMADSGVSVYPADARGLEPFAGLLAENRGPTTLNRDPNATISRMEALRASAMNSQDTMREVAEKTGGRVFLNRNDLDTAVSTAISDNVASYTVAYYPTDKKWDGRFRRIQVKTSRPDLKLLFRQGYYAVDASQDKAGDRELQSALLLDPGQSSNVIFYAHVQPDGGKLKVDFFVKGFHLRYKDEGADKVADLDFRAVAFADGKTVPLQSQTAHLKLNQQQWEKAVSSGFMRSFSVNLPQNATRLRLAVRDNQSGDFGITDIPLPIQLAGN